MWVFPVRIKDALDIPVERPHHSDPRKHRWPAQIDD
jgi:hypothetical protein